MQEIKKSIRREVKKQFGISSYVSSDAIDYLAESFTNKGVQTGKDVEEAIATIFDMILREKADLDIITKEAVQVVVDGLLNVQNETARIGSASTVTAHEAFRIVDIFSLPQYRLVNGSKFHLFEDLKSVFGTVDQRIQVFTQRYELVKQHLGRSELFKSSLSENESIISPIKALLGNVDQEFTLFGMLTRMEDEKIYLEDLDGEVRLDLSEAKISPGLFTETCLALVGGIYQAGNVFKVSELAMPPIEKRRETLLSHPEINFFGGHPYTIDDHVLKTLEMDENQMMVIISDVWLDKEEVLQKFRELFAGYLDAKILPVAFILMGDFLSSYDHEDIAKIYRDTFKQFASTVAEFPDIAKMSHFVFIPGPNDLWANCLLPRLPLPEYLTETMRNRIYFATFASNPCRIQFCSQNLIFFRQDLISKAVNNMLIKPNMQQEPDIVKHLITTIHSQATLNPFPLHVSPVIWSYAQSLNVYPLPHLLILGDKYAPYECVENECCVANPGSFVDENFQFLVYFPSTRRCDPSQL